MYFNPRPREEGDKPIDNRNILSKNISIHALVKRATYTPVFGCSFKYISIHALVKRATRKRLLSDRRSTHFNPRPREEGDRCIYAKTGAGAISIHALVKRATSYQSWRGHAEKDFNPRPREEGDG